MTYRLNAYSISLSGDSLTGHVLAAEPGQVRELRARYGTDWSLHYRDGDVVAFQRKPGAKDLGVPTELSVADNLWLIKARLTDELPSLFERYEAWRKRPFSILSQKHELVSEIAKRAKLAVRQLEGIEIRPCTEVDPRLVEFEDGKLRLVLVIDVSTRWEIHRPLDELEAQGVQVAGLTAVRRSPGEGERRLVGRIGGIDGDVVRLSDAIDDVGQIASSEVWIEGNREAFRRCLQAILGIGYKAFEQSRQDVEAELFSSEGIDQVCNSIADYLRKLSPIQLTPNVTCSVGGRVTFPRDLAVRSIVELEPTRYCFDTAKAKQTDYAWQGIEKFGPYSRETLGVRSPTFLVVCPATVLGRVEQFLQQLRNGVLAEEKSRYPSGFASTFGLRNEQFEICTLSPNPSNPGSSYRNAIEAYLSKSSTKFDAAIVVVLDEHERLPAARNPYLFSKAFLLANGIPTQVLRTGTISQRPASLQYTLQNIAVALYAKLGGTPWTVNHNLTVNDELVLGVGTAIVGDSRFGTRRRQVGITTVFRGDGNYLLSHLAKQCSFEEYPQTLRASTIEVLRDLKQRNGWQPGDSVRLVFHGAHPMKRVDVGKIIGECAREVAGEQNLQFAFMTVTHDHPFILSDDSKPGIPVRGKRKGRHAPARGTLLQLGRFTRLLATTDARLVKRPESPLPRPLLLNLHRDSTYVDLEYLCEQALKFTTLSWRSTQPASGPVSIYYSHLIASLLGRLQFVPDWSPATLNTQLRFSRWFL